MNQKHAPHVTIDTVLFDLDGTLADTAPDMLAALSALLRACACCASDVAQCVYIGDDPRDIQAGEAAGMTTLVALYGYIGEEQNPHTWDADGVLHDIAQLPAWLRSRNGACRPQ